MYQLSPNYSHILFLCIALLINNLTTTFAQDFSQQYDEVSEFSEGWAAVRKGDKWGIIDEKGKTIAPIQYRTARVVSLDCDVTGLLLNGDYCFVEGSQIRCYNRLYPFSDKGYAKVYNNGLYGFINKKGVEVLPVQYKRIEDFRDTGFFTVEDTSRRKGIMDSEFVFLVPLIYDNIYKLGDYFQVENDDLLGVINRKGEIILPQKYHKIKTVPNSDVWILITDTVPTSSSIEGYCEMFNINKGEVLPDDYDHLYSISIEGYEEEQSLFIVSKNGIYGIINGEGKVILPFEYERLGVVTWSKKYLIARKDGKYGVINIKGEVIIPLEYERLETVAWSKKHLKAKKDGKYGVIDTKGEITVPLEYEQLPDKKRDGFFEYRKVFTVVTQNYKYGIMDTAYQLLVPFDYHSLVIDNPNRIVAQKGRYMGVIDINNKVVIPFEFIKLEVWNDRKWYLVAKKEKGKVIGESHYYSEEENKYIKTEVTDGRVLYGIMDTLQNIILPFERGYEFIGKFSRKLVRVKKNNKYGFMNGEGVEIIAPKYDEIEEGWCNRGILTAGKMKHVWDRIIIENGGKKGLIDDLGNTIIEPIYDKIQCLRRDGLLQVTKDEKQGLCSHDGKVIVEANKYDGILNSYFFHDRKLYLEKKKVFSNGYATVLQNEKKGIIDSTGREVLSPQLTYGFIFPFDKYGIAIVNNEGKRFIRPSKSFSLFPHYKDYKIKGGKWGLINTKGEELLSLDYSSIRRYKNGGDVLIASKKGQLYAYNLELKKLSTPYDEIRPFTQNIAMVKKDKQWGVLHKNQTEILKPQFDKIKYGQSGDRKVILVERNGKWGAISTITGQIIIPPKYSDLSDIGNNRLAYNIGKVIDLCLKEEPKNGLWGLVDYNGNELTEAEYEMINQFSEGLATYNVGAKTTREKGRINTSGGKWGIIDTMGNIISKPIYCEQKIPFKNGYMLMVVCSENEIEEKHNKVVVDGKGEVVFPEKYAKFNVGYSEERFKNELIAAQKNDKWQLLHLGKRRRVGKYSYDRVPDIELNAAIATRNDSIYLINLEGKELINITQKYGEIHCSLRQGFCWISKKRKQGLMDITGKELLKPEYESISIDNKTGKVEAYKDGKTMEFDFK